MENVDKRTRAGREVTRNASAGKPKRQRVGAGNKLEFAGKDPNYEYRVVSDNPGRGIHCGASLPPRPP